MQWQYTSADKARSPMRKATENHFIIFLRHDLFSQKPAGNSRRPRRRSTEKGYS